MIQEHIKLQWGRARLKIVRNVARANTPVDPAPLQKESATIAILERTSLDWGPLRVRPAALDITLAALG